MQIADLQHGKRSNTQSHFARCLSEASALHRNLADHLKKRKAILMARFVGPIHGPLGSVQSCPEVRSAVMATTTILALLRRLSGLVIIVLRIVAWKM